MNLQATFEVAKIDLSDGAIGTIRLAPAVREKPGMLSSSSFAIFGLELGSGAGVAPGTSFCASTAGVSTAATSSAYCASNGVAGTSAGRELSRSASVPAAAGIFSSVAGAGTVSEIGSPAFKFSETLGGPDDIRSRGTLDSSPVGA